MLEIADIIRQAGPAYMQQFGSRLLPSHHRVLRDLLRCRTPALGGHVRQCDHAECGELRYSYHSCRNRHCPKCQQPETDRWLEKQQSRGLSCPYFFVTFTLPSQLRELARSHQKTVYSILMRAAADAVLALSQDPKFLGGCPGLLGVLHTWTRDLRYHPHVHFLVTGGGLSPDGPAWRKTSSSDFLMPQYVLADLVRRMLKEALTKAGLIGLAPRRIWRTRWVVDIEPAGSGQEVLAYLARYVHRIAIPNSRIERYRDGQVTFRYRDSRSQELRRCTVSEQEFLRRFLQHVLPKGFVKIRTYGLYASARRDDLATARKLLDLLHQVEGGAAEVRSAKGPSAPEVECTDEDADPECPVCGIGRLRIIQTLPRQPTLPPCARDPPKPSRPAQRVSSAVER